MESSEYQKYKKEFGEDSVVARMQKSLDIRNEYFKQHAKKYLGRLLVMSAVFLAVLSFIIIPKNINVACFVFLAAIVVLSCYVAVKIFENRKISHKFHEEYPEEAKITDFIEEAVRRIFDI